MSAPANWHIAADPAEHAIARRPQSLADAEAHALALFARHDAADAAAHAARMERRERERAEVAMRRMHGAFAWLVGACLAAPLVALAYALSHLIGA